MGDSKEKTKKGVSSPKNIHGIVNHTGVKVISSILMLIILGASGYATYRFTERDAKSTEMYVGLAFMWVGVIAFLYILIAKIIMGKYFFLMMSELHEHEPGVYYMLLFTIFAFLATFGAILYSNVELEPPLGLSYTRHCPVGTELGTKVKPPSQLS